MHDEQQYEHNGCKMVSGVHEQNNCGAWLTEKTTQKTKL